VYKCFEEGCRFDLRSPPDLLWSWSFYIVNIVNENEKLVFCYFLLCLSLIIR
jgi:hypothetical protein